MIPQWSLSLSPGPQSSLVPPCKISLGSPVQWYLNIVESGVINKQTIQVIMYVDTFKLTLLFLSVVSLCVWHQMTDNFQCQSHYCLFFQYHWTGLPREILQGGTRLLWGPGDKLRHWKLSVIWCQTHNDTTDKNNNVSLKVSTYIITCIVCLFITPLSTIFQWYRGSQK
jgi:hypothetical protein